MMLILEGFRARFTSCLWSISEVETLPTTVAPPLPTGRARQALSGSSLPRPLSLLSSNANRLSVRKGGVEKIRRHNGSEAAAKTRLQEVRIHASGKPCLLACPDLSRTAWGEIRVRLDKLGAGSHLCRASDHLKQEPWRGVKTVCRSARFWGRFGEGHPRLEYRSCPIARIDYVVVWARTSPVPLRPVHGRSTGPFSGPVPRASSCFSW